MTPRWRVLVVALGGLLGVLSADSARATVLGPELLTNGSFEEPDVNTNTYAIFGAIPGWTSTVGAGIEIQDHVAGSPFDGDQHVELDSNNPSNMFQDVATQMGALYRVEFAYSPRPRVLSNDVDVYWDGQLLQSLMGSGVGAGDTVWQVYQFDVLATGATTRLEFIDVGTSDSLGGYLDAASVREYVPEPSGLLLLGLGTLTLAGIRQRLSRE